MISLRHSLGRSLPRLLAVLIVAVTPGALRAETVWFRNDCRAAVTVQAATVVRGVIKRDQYLLRHKEETPKVKLDTDKVLQVLDSRTGRVLYKNVLRSSQKPLAYSITVDRNTGRVRLAPIPPASDGKK